MTLYLCVPSSITRSTSSAFSLRVPCHACPHVRMSAAACDSFAGLRPVYVRVLVRMCVCTCVPGESVAGQRVPPDPGHAGGGDADDRQPLRLCFLPLLISALLHRLQGPPARGTPPNIITKGQHTRGMVHKRNRTADIFPFLLTLP